MPARRVGTPTPVPPDLAAALSALRVELEVPDGFSPEVTAAARRAASAVRLPELDRTDLELLTIDPPGSTDLDQALHLTRDDDQVVVSYAIADPAAAITPGDPVDREAHRRGLTLYAPDARVPLHPPVLSEDALSLRPGEVRPALLWTLRLASGGAMTSVDVRRARVRSREQLTYERAQAEIDAGRPRETLALLAEVGRWREQRERDRGGVSLQTPEQQVEVSEHGWRLTYRASLPVESWNAQISLLTGMAAAHLMLYGQVGLLRTLPPADHGDLRRLRQTAKALHLAWPAEVDYPEFVRRLDSRVPAEAAMLTACATLFRGAGYTAFSGGVPEEAEHAALAIDYAHVTAPLRRLADRYAGEVCVALCEDRPVPGWVLRALDRLPAEMRAAERRARTYERRILDLVESFLLRDRRGECFPGVVVEVSEDRRRGVVMLSDPAVAAAVGGDALPLGHAVTVRLVAADPAVGGPEFELVPP